MRKQDEFKELVQFWGAEEDEPLAGLLKFSDVTFKLTRRVQKQPWFSPSSQMPLVLKVLDKDYKRAKYLLSQYQKTKGVPFS